MIAGELVHLKGYAGLHPATGAVARFPEAGLPVRLRGGEGAPETPYGKRKYDCHTLIL